MIGQTFSHYRITKRLGAGGMGAVYAADDTRLGRRVALKFPTANGHDSNFHTRFLREARALSALSHPHIAIVYDYGETDSGQPFIVMELIEGCSLSDLLREGKLSLQRTLEIIEQTAEALAEAHRRGVVHRDIKPSNVMINERGMVKVLDFGLAKHFDKVGAGGVIDLDAATLLTASTQSGAMMGTPLYFSPEQARGADVDPRSDLFALGAVLYEAVAGRHPFAGANLIEVISQILFVEPAPPSDANDQIPPELDLVVLRLLSKQMEARYQNADELIADLRAVRSLLPEDERAIDSNGHRASECVTLSPSARPRASRGSVRTLPARRVTDEGRPRAALALPAALASPAALAVICGVVLITLLALWSFVWRQPAPYRPSPDAARWYETGAAALRDGAPLQATRAFERALASDDRFLLARARMAEALNELDYTDRAKDELLRIQSLDAERAQLPERDRLYLEAVTATATRNFTRAVASYRELAGLEPDAPAAHFDLGRALERADDFAAALASYQRASGIDAQYAAASLRAAVIHSRRQDSAAAIAAFDRAESLYRDFGNTEGRAEAVYQRGAFLINLGRFTEARAQFQSALDMARATGNDYQQIRSLLQLSNALHTQGDTARAEVFATEATSLARANGMDNLVAGGLVDIGNVFFARGSYPEAERYFRQAFETAQRIGARRAEARARLSLGSLFIQRDNANEGVRWVEQALAFYQQDGYRKEAGQALLLIGRVNRDRGDYDAALRAFEQQLQLAQQSGDLSQTALAHGEVGMALFHQERYPEALQHFDQKYALGMSLGDQLSTGYSLVSRGDVLWRLGRYTDARTALAQAATIAERSEADYRALATHAQYVNAAITLSERRFADAITETRRFIASARSQSRDNHVAEATLLLGLAQSLSGARTEGRATSEQAVAALIREGNSGQLHSAWLTLAETLLQSGETENSLATALRAQEGFARAGRQDSEWRAWLIAAHASRLRGDEPTARQYASRAADVLSNIRQRWGTEAYDGYVSRPDIQHFRRQHGAEVVLNQ